MDMHASRDSLHQKIMGIVVDIVSVVFQEEEVLDRKELLYVLMSQQQRAVVRREGGRGGGNEWRMGREGRRRVTWDRRKRCVFVFCRMEDLFMYMYLL